LQPTKRLHCLDHLRACQTRLAGYISKLSDILLQMLNVRKSDATASAVFARGQFIKCAGITPRKHGGISAMIWGSTCSCTACGK